MSSEGRPLRRPTPCCVCGIIACPQDGSPGHWEWYPPLLRVGEDYEGPWTDVDMDYPPGVDPDAPEPRCFGTGDGAVPRLDIDGLAE